MIEAHMSDVDRAGAKRWYRPARTVGVAAVLLLAAYLVVRGIAEFFVIDYAHPLSYHDSWGGPSLAGVLAVHSGPALVILAAASVWVYRRRRARATGRAGGRSPSRRRLGVAALLGDPGARLAAPPRDEQGQRDAQADDAADYQDHAHRLDVHVLGHPGDRETQDRADDDECDAASDGHRASTRIARHPGTRCRLGGRPYTPSASAVRRILRLRHSRVSHPSQVTYPFVIKVTAIHRPVSGFQAALICRTGSTASPVVGGHPGVFAPILRGWIRLHRFARWAGGSPPQWRRWPRASQNGPSAWSWTRWM